jgi:hypothetical protein
LPRPIYPGKNTRYPSYRKLGWLQGPMDACGKSRSTRIRSPDRPAHSEFLYRLRYSGPNNNSIQFMFINVPSQHPVDQVQKQHNIPTNINSK